MLNIHFRKPVRRASESSPSPRAQSGGLRNQARGKSVGCMASLSPDQSERGNEICVQEVEVKNEIYRALALGYPDPNHHPAGDLQSHLTGAGRLTRSSVPRASIRMGSAISL